MGRTRTREETTSDEALKRAEAKAQARADKRARERRAAALKAARRRGDRFGVAMLKWAGEKFKGKPALVRDDELHAKYREIMEELGRGDPLSVDDYAEFIRELAPLYNDIHIDRRMCLKCGAIFAVESGHDERAEFCSTRCGGSVRTARHYESSEAAKKAAARGAKRSAKDKKLAKWVESHAKRCPKCGAGASCPELEIRLIASTDALARRAHGVDAEAGERIARQDGNRRTPARRGSGDRA